MPGRAPRPDVDDLAVTHDELAPVDTRPPVDLPELEAVEAVGLQVRPLGSGDQPPIDDRRRLDAAFFDDDTLSPQLRDFIHETRAIAVDASRKASEALAARRRTSRLRAIGIPTLSGIAGFAVAVLTYALAFARDQGDAAGAKRERESAWVQVLHDVRELRERQAVVFTRLDGLDNLLRLYFPAGAVRLQGPTIDPRPVSPPP